MTGVSNAKNISMSGGMVFLQGPFLEEFQLDIVGFLAILGEGSVLANAQVATLSRLQFIPRLLPAPQALLMPSRPSKLESTPGRVTAVHSGNHVERIGHIGHVVIDAENMPDYSVRCVRITRKNKNPVKARTVAPLSSVIFLGLAEAVALLGLSIHHHDGFALVSILLLASLSSLIGVGNKWKLKLPRRAKGAHVPDGNVVIRYPKGSFLVVECDEDVARELYFAPEGIEYLVAHPWKYRIISLLGTLMLMVGVVCLANADIYQQVAVAGAYILLNAAYWIVAALPPKVHWDLTCFEVSDQRFDVPGDVNKHFVDHNPTFTKALWKAIVATKSIDWVRLDNAAPQTQAWNDWLIEAVTRACAVSFHEDKDGTKVWEMPDWDPQAALIDLMKEYAPPEKGATLA